MNKILVSIILLFSIAALSAQEMTIDSAGDVNIINNLNVNETANLKKNVIISGILNVDKATLHVNPETDIVTIKSLTVNNGSRFYDNVTIGPDAGTKKLTVNGNIEATGTLNVGGTTTLKTTNVSGNVNIKDSGTLTVSGTTTLNGVTNFNNTANITGTITASGTTNLNGQTNLKNTTINGNTTITKNLNVSGTLIVQGGLFHYYQYKGLNLGQNIYEYNTLQHNLTKAVTISKGPNRWNLIDLSDLIDLNAMKLHSLDFRIEFSLVGDKNDSGLIYLRPFEDGDSTNPTSADVMMDSGAGWYTPNGAPTGTKVAKVFIGCSPTINIPLSRLSTKFYFRSQREFYSNQVKVTLTSVAISP